MNTELHFSPDLYKVETFNYLLRPLRAAPDIQVRSRKPVQVFEKDVEIEIKDEKPIDLTTMSLEEFSRWHDMRQGVGDYRSAKTDDAKHRAIRSILEFHLGERH